MCKNSIQTILQNTALGNRANRQGVIAIKRHGYTRERTPSPTRADSATSAAR